MNFFSSFVMLSRMLHVILLSCCWIPSIEVLNADAAAESLEEQFVNDTRPFMDKYCLDCHSGAKPKAKFDLTPYQDIQDVVEDFGHWELIMDMLENQEMPPEDEDLQPPDEVREGVLKWIQSLKREEAQKNAGDPGMVLARRLSNAEYNYTIRDLTGVDLQPTREFPIDPANEEGFDNTGESLTLSPALLKKYLQAARGISEHLVLKPDGLAFAEFPVLTETDRDKYCVNRIISFYKSQNIQIEDYFAAAWIYKYRDTTKPDLILESIAIERKLSAKYLRTVWSMLEGELNHWGPIENLRNEWQALPRSLTPGETYPKEHIHQLAEYVRKVRDVLQVEVPHLRVRGIHNGCQAFVLWRNREKAGNRMSMNLDRLIEHPDKYELELGFRLPPSKDESESDLDLLEFAKESIEHFCSVFPDAFFISERGREFLDPDPKRKATEKGRLLSAGFHSMMGYFRDDQPLYQRVLNKSQQAELDRLWDELDFITHAPVRQHQSLVWFERTDSRFMRSEEFDFARAEDKDVTSEEKIMRLSEVYLAKALEAGAGSQAADAIREHFQLTNKSIRWVEQTRLKARSIHLDALVEFAERAYRRPVDSLEKNDLVSFYRELMVEGNLTHEDAIRDCVVSVLMSPHFWYRFDIPSSQPGIHPIADISLASRLSYFLWASMPDELLLQDARKGVLREKGILLGHVKRMIADDRFRGFSVEFGGHWLGFRRFESHNSVDRKRFPNFTSDLRQSMFEEPIRFFMDMARENRSVLDFIFGQHTWIDALLAEHYEVMESEPLEQIGLGDWVRVKLDEKGRGGLLPMAVFQTLHAPGLRTSPVKRGYWVVRQLLGEHIPPPPPNVPELPSDESLMELPLPAMLERHRALEDCATCHEKFDAIGLAFEGYGPVGERREVDLAGRPVSDDAEFPRGVKGKGLSGLKSYLAQHRQTEFVEHLSRQIFSFALGRSLIPSDEPVLESMRERLLENEYRFQTLINEIVTSPQFLNQRGNPTLATANNP
jgi:hypothetical protein